MMNPPTQQRILARPGVIVPTRPTRQTVPNGPIGPTETAETTGRTGHGGQHWRNWQAGQTTAATSTFITMTNATNMTNAAATTTTTTTAMTTAMAEPTVKRAPTPPPFPPPTMFHPAVQSNARSMAMAQNRAMTANFPTPPPTPPPPATATMTTKMTATTTIPTMPPRPPTPPPVAPPPSVHHGVPNHPSHQNHQSHLHHPGNFNPNQSNQSMPLSSSNQVQHNQNQNQMQNNRTQTQTQIGKLPPMEQPQQTQRISSPANATNATNARNWSNTGNIAHDAHYGTNVNNFNHSENIRGGRSSLTAVRPVPPPPSASLPSAVSAVSAVSEAKAGPPISSGSSGQPGPPVHPIQPVPSQNTHSWNSNVSSWNNAPSSRPKLTVASVASSNQHGQLPDNEANRGSNPTTMSDQGHQNWHGKQGRQGQPHGNHENQTNQPHHPNQIGHRNGSNIIWKEDDNPKSPHNYSNNLSSFLNRGSVSSVSWKDDSNDVGKSNQNDNVSSNDKENEELQTSREDSPSPVDGSQPPTNAGEKVLQSLFSPNFKQQSRSGNCGGRYGGKYGGKYGGTHGGKHGGKAWGGSGNRDNRDNEHSISGDFSHKDSNDNQNGSNSNHSEKGNNNTGGHASHEVGSEGSDEENEEQHAFDSMRDVTFEAPSSCEGSFLSSHAGGNSVAASARRDGQTKDDEDVSSRCSDQSSVQSDNSGFTGCIFDTCSNKKKTRQKKSSAKSSKLSAKAVTPKSAKSTSGSGKVTPKSASKTTPKLSRSQMSDISSEDEFYTPTSTASAYHPSTDIRGAESDYHSDPRHAIDFDEQPSSSASPASPASSHSSSSDPTHNDGNISYNSFNSSKHHLLSSFQNGRKMLPPVWEDEEMKCQTKVIGGNGQTLEGVFVCCDPFQNVMGVNDSMDGDNQSEVSYDDVDKKELREEQRKSLVLPHTPKQSSLSGDGDDDEFFSPMEHSYMMQGTPKGKEWEDVNKMAREQGHERNEPRKLHYHPHGNGLSTTPQPMANTHREVHIGATQRTSMSTSANINLLSPISAAVCNNASHISAHSFISMGSISPPSSPAKNDAIKSKNESVSRVSDQVESRPETNDGTTFDHSPDLDPLSEDASDSMILTRALSVLSSSKRLASKSSPPTSNASTSPQQMQQPDTLPHVLSDVPPEPNSEPHPEPSNLSYSALSSDLLTSINTPSTSPAGVNQSHRSHHSHDHTSQQSRSVVTLTYSDLPAGALTVDFVRKCDSLEMLQNILSVLSESGNGSGKPHQKKRLRYPRLGKFVEKRIEWVRANRSETSPKIQVQEPDARVDSRQTISNTPRSIDTSVSHSSVDLSLQNKENFDPKQHQPREESFALSTPSTHGSEFGHLSNTSHMPNASSSRLESIPDGEAGPETPEINIANSTADLPPGPIPSSSPSTSFRPASMTHDSTLDMNLSESLFTLEDETFYWKQMENEDDGDYKDKVNEMIGDWANNLSMSRNEGKPGGKQSIAKSSREEEMKPDRSKEEVAPVTDARYLELKEKLASALASHAQLTREVDSLVKEHDAIQSELSSKLREAEQALATEKAVHLSEIQDMELGTEHLRNEVQILQEKLYENEDKAQMAARRMQSQLEETKQIHKQLVQDQETMDHELAEVRLAYDKAQVEIVRLKSEASEDVHKLREDVNAAKTANDALAKALAMSEKDLAQVSQERDSLLERNHALSSKVDEIDGELKRRNTYIDQLCADRKETEKAAQAARAELEEKESEWKKKDHRYRRKIEQLERKVEVGYSRQRSTEEMNNMIAKYRNDFLKKQKEIDGLKSTINHLHDTIAQLKSESENSVEPKRVTPRNDENVAPPQKSMDLNPGGKQFNRTAVVKAAGGKKGLSEKYMRRFGKNLNKVEAATSGNAMYTF